MTSKRPQAAGSSVPAEVTARVGGRVVKLVVRNGEVLLPKSLTARAPIEIRQRIPGTRRGPAKVAFSSSGTSAYAADATARRLVDVLGSNTVADLLGVARDRPGRWWRGVGAPEAANRAALADLDALVAQLLAAFTPEQASLWLVGDNAHLGAPPLDVFRVHGSGPVIEAIRAHEQGAFA